MLQHPGIVTSALVATLWIPAHAEIPQPANCVVPDVVFLVGRDDAYVADPRGAFTVTLRDASYNPLPGDQVWIDFGECGGLDICTPEICPRIVATTNATGVARFAIVGARTNATELPACAKIFGQGVPLGTRPVAAFDQDGINGVNGVDLALFGADLFSGVAHSRSDFDGDGDVDGMDLSRFAEVLFGGGSLRSCSFGYCP